jgi:NAD+ kinase
VTIERIGIVAKSGLAAAAPHLRLAIDWLAERHVPVVVDPDTAALLGGGPVPDVASRDEITRRVDLVVVLGGDGTLLGLADRVGEAGRDTPILGVNFGRLGFLTEVTLPEMLPALESALAGSAHVHERAMLRARMLRNGEPLAEHIVLNDVVVTKGAISRLIYLAVHVDGRFVTDVKADGLILGSPTGSTAYSLAAGGPIVHPGVDALLITPIAPHALGNRPIVIPGRCTISVRPAADSGKDEMFATFDGQTGYAFGHGDEVLVTRADRVLRLIGSPTRGYYDTLRQKLHWGER